MKFPGFNAGYCGQLNEIFFFIHFSLARKKSESKPDFASLWEYQCKFIYVMFIFMIFVYGLITIVCHAKKHAKQAKKQKQKNESTLI